MSRSVVLNYPPEEIFRVSYPQRKNFEHIILWMLKNNEIVEWSDFKEDPINIPQSTLSNYINKLDSKGYVEKIKRGVYRITPMGEDRFNELSRAKEVKRKLNHPPNAILKKRNYVHILLWMAYNNNYCKWADFLESPLRINQSSLSKNLNLLLDNEFIRKENKEYRITQAGKSEYSRMLKLYDLDRQSILNEESKRIEEITKKTIAFFIEHNIKDDDIKFRFLNNVLKLPFEKMRGSLESEDDFNKVLLFLSINHPNQYPDHISTEKFSKKYDIDKLDLEFNIRRIVDKDIYSNNFFKLETDDNKVYCFQVNEKIEKVLNAITEDYITKYTYLNKLYEETPNGIPTLNLDFTVNAILNEVCDTLFNEGLRESLKNFLPEYIKYLAYKIETEKQLLDTLDKLEGIAWRNIPEVFQSYSSIDSKYESIDQTHLKYHLDLNILRILEIFSSAQIVKIFEESKALMKKRNHIKGLDLINSAIETDQENVDLLFIKAIVLSLLNRHQEAIEFLNNEVKVYLDKNEEEVFVPYHMIMVFCQITFGRFDKALKVSNKLSTAYPDHPISHIIRALIPGYKLIYELDLGQVKIDQVLDEIDKAISLDPKKSNKTKYYQFKSLILKHLNKFEDAIEAINVAIELDPKDIKLCYSKIDILLSFKEFKEALEFIEEKLKIFPEEKKDLTLKKAHVFKKMHEFDEAIRIVNQLIEDYSDDLNLLNHKAYIHMYNKEEEEAIQSAKLLTESTPDDGNYHDTFGEILTEFGHYEEALKELEKALELEPVGWFAYNSYIQKGKCYKEIGNYKLARKNLEKGKIATGTCYSDCEMRNHYHKKADSILKEIEELETKSKS